MSNTEKETFLIAAKGFSANGVSMEEGEYLSNQFDEQTAKVLLRMGRLVETDVPPGDEPKMTAAEKRAAKAAAATGGLPGMPGT